MSGYEDATRVKTGLAAVALLVLMVVGIGCGPIQSTSRIGEAEVAFERSRVAEAHIRAPYEYYSAKYYLHKANEEWGYSDFEASYDYATKAKRAAEAALLKAKEDPWVGHPNPEIDPLEGEEPEPEGYRDRLGSEPSPEGFQGESDAESTGGAK